jgi:hypothetical protein
VRFRSDCLIGLPAMTTMNNIYEILTVTEAARLWSLDESTVRKALIEGRLSGRKSAATHLTTIQEMRRVYGVPIRIINDIEYAVVGAGDYGQALAAMLVARFAGHYIKDADIYLYHNGADDYQHLVNQVEN